MKKWLTLLWIVYACEAADASLVKLQMLLFQTEQFGKAVLNSIQTKISPKQAIDRLNSRLVQALSRNGFQEENYGTGVKDEEITGGWLSYFSSSPISPEMKITLKVTQNLSPIGTMAIQKNSDNSLAIVSFTSTAPEHAQIFERAFLETFLDYGRDIGAPSISVSTSIAKSAQQYRMLGFQPDPKNPQLLLYEPGKPASPAIKAALTFPDTLENQILSIITHQLKPSENNKIYSYVHINADAQTCQISLSINNHQYKADVFIETETATQAHAFITQLTDDAQNTILKNILSGITWYSEAVGYRTVKVSYPPSMKREDRIFTLKKSQ